MELGIRYVGDYQVVALKGELTLYSLPRASRWLDEGLAKEGTRVALDLSELEFIDSSGISSLIYWRKLVTDAGGHFVLLSVPDSLRKLLKLGRLDQNTDFVESEADLQQS